MHLMGEDTKKWSLNFFGKLLITLTGTGSTTATKYLWMNSKPCKNYVKTM